MYLTSAGLRLSVLTSADLRFVFPSWGATTFHASGEWEGHAWHSSSLSSRQHILSFRTETEKARFELTAWNENPVAVSRCLWLIRVDGFRVKV